MTEITFSRLSLLLAQSAGTALMLGPSDVYFLRFLSQRRPYSRCAVKVAETPHQLFHIGFGFRYQSSQNHCPFELRCGRTWRKQASVIHEHGDEVAQAARKASEFF